MKIILIPISLLFLINFSCNREIPEAKPPEAKIQEVVDNYFGRQVTDQYRYMENLQDTSVQRWLREQSDYSREILNMIPVRQSLIEKMQEFDKRRASNVGYLAITENNRYFYFKTSSEDKTAKLFCRDGYEGTETLLFDPQSFSTDPGENYSLSYFSPSDDGTMVAIEMGLNGSESSFLITIDVESRRIFPERIDRIWWAFPYWLPDGSGFLYNRMQSGDIYDKNRQKGSKSLLHIIGTDPSADKEILSFEKYPGLDFAPTDVIRVFYDKGSGYLFGLAIREARLNVFYAPANELYDEKINWVSLIRPEDEIYDFKNSGNEIYALSAKNSPNFKILKSSLMDVDFSNAEEIVPEYSNGSITSFDLTSEGLYYAVSINGIEGKLYHLAHETKEDKELNLPLDAGSVYLRTRGFKYDDIWVSISGWTSNSRRFRYLASEDAFYPENLSTTSDYPEYSDLVIEELMIKSHDSVNVPLSLIYQKGLKKDGKNRVLLNGYGAYGESFTPYLNINLLLWTLEGGILAIPHVRGGGELGEQWRLDGLKTTKANTWKDLISCTEFLIAKKYTSKQKIAVYGLSAGGILVGRAMTERPDLFAAAIAEVGIMNPLRFEETPNGPMNVSEFGTVKDSLECMALIEMDSYLQIKDGVEYPAALITAGINDPRVIAWQPAKFAARLQYANRSKEPVLFLVDFEAGHGVGNTKLKWFERMADVLSFALWQTGDSHSLLD